MKKLILIALFTTCYIPIKAQRITYNDLLYVLNHNIASVEDYLSNKGFEYQGNDTIRGESPMVSYSFNKQTNDIFSSYQVIDKKSINEIFFEVSLMTYQQSDYLKIKEVVKSKGFSLKKTRVVDGYLENIYTNKNIDVSFMIGKSRERDISIYYISMTDLKKRIEINNM